MAPQWDSVHKMLSFTPQALKRLVGFPAWQPTAGTSACGFQSPHPSPLLCSPPVCFLYLGDRKSELSCTGFMAPKAPVGSICKDETDGDSDRVITLLTSTVPGVDRAPGCVHNVPRFLSDCASEDFLHILQRKWMGFFTLQLCPRIPLRGISMNYPHRLFVFVQPAGSRICKSWNWESHLTQFLRFIPPFSSPPPLLSLLLFLLEIVIYNIITLFIIRNHDSCSFNLNGNLNYTTWNEFKP